MKACFADTFFFLALLNRTSLAHQRAVELNRVDRPILTTWFILLELADHLCEERNRRLFGMILDAISTDPRFEIVDVDAGLLGDAVKLYHDRPDKSWSLTDCTSFLSMKTRGITEALTGDHHFEQAGFIALLKS